MPKVTKARKDECRARLLELLKPGDTIDATVTHVSRSGMQRRIDFYIYRCEGGEVSKQWITPFIGDLLEWGWNDAGVRVDGCGMDMIFHTVYTLGAVLWPKGYRCTGDGAKHRARRCQSSDHNNPVRDDEGKIIARAPAPDGRTRHRDSGYALRYR